MDIKAIVFDKDGTLLDFNACWVPVARAATTDMLAELGRPDIPVEEIMASLGYEGDGFSADGVICYGTYTLMADAMLPVLKKHGCTPDRDTLRAITVKTYDKNIHKGVIKPTCENIVSVLKALKNMGIKLFLVTLDDAACTKRCLEKLGIFSLFDEIFTDDGDYPVKPDPFCINMLCKMHKIDKNALLMVGDTLTDFDFASYAGIGALGVAKSEKNRKILEKRFDFVVPDISFIENFLK